ncbi:lysophospholipase L1-like esterase [Dysgonomonas sp. PFB1-18]|uniref:SGNH/GDSL hydrolase family protein n=1 Tax=unclassified Dysgonomonas TaxID=2630389 RepID=UPI0024734746|nr:MULTISPECIES: SGNH/GDSL hydrolase family protein [unclassified Dysgonomonas]MDH6309967.1 lysophospholipase L1-like esterase [Dysgonomonas sp. PF1-14]MDH6339876.1 lysophospholipase L1-like esterase [Dysgonomonas sp. PF1-16]MDH6381524.1 lysophospholipase L1-like esterase [Dysgonomonas sp. PFB1-18]MDH6398839.1 lysophospholipase L1-like esterase [Dysgonomonas sp. PF1-23]
MKRIIVIMSILSFLGLSSQAQSFNEQAGLQRYEKANAELPAPAEGEKRVVFIGNSITQGWADKHPDFFNSNNYIGRGIGGQTSPQLLLRFRQDVIDLKPVAVVINIGTNDIAENTGTYNTDFTLGNIKSMAELADANGIKVILSSITPAGEYPWRKDIKNVPDKIESLNTKIKKYANEKGFAYIDYFAVMHDENRALITSYGYDGVHPTEAGYDVMEKVAKAVIDEVIK